MKKEGRKKEKLHLPFFSSVSLFCFEVSLLQRSQRAAVQGCRRETPRETISQKTPAAAGGREGPTAKAASFS